MRFWLTSCVKTALKKKRRLESHGSNHPGGDFCGRNRTGLQDSLGGGISYAWNNQRLQSMALYTENYKSAQVGFSYDTVGRLSSLTRTANGDPGTTPAEIQSAIVSLKTRAVEHTSKATNPAAYVADWTTRNPQAQQGLINYCLKEAQTYSEQTDVLRGLLGAGG